LKKSDGFNIRRFFCFTQILKCHFKGGTTEKSSSAYLFVVQNLIVELLECCFGRAPAGRAIHLYCTGISHKAGIRYYPSRGLFVSY